MSVDVDVVSSRVRRAGPSSRHASSRLVQLWFHDSDARRLQRRRDVRSYEAIDAVRMYSIINSSSEPARTPNEWKCASICWKNTRRRRRADRRRRM